MNVTRVIVAATLLVMLSAWTASAQLLDRKALSLAEAKKIAAAAEAEAVKNKWNMVIAIVDDGGNLLFLERMDDVQLGSVEVAQGKARTSALFRRSTKIFEDAVKGGRNVVLNLTRDITPIQGGLPIVAGGRVIGAIGVSGATSEQDEQVAKAGADLVK